MQPQLQPVPEPAPSPFGFRGLVAIFYSPSDAFIPGKGKWILPMVAACLIALLTNAIVVQRVGLGTIVRNQLESNERIASQLGPEGINQAVARAENSTIQKSLSYVGPLVAIPVMLAIFAGIALGCFMVTGGQTTFSTVLTAGSWAAYAAAVVTCAGLTAVVYSMSDFSGVDVRSMFALNAGIFAGEGRPVVKALLGGIDLIAVWTIFLQTVGVTKLSQRVSVPQAVGTFVTLHVLVTLLKAGWSAMFG